MTRHCVAQLGCSWTGVFLGFTKLLLVSSLALLGCAKKDDVILHAADGRQLTAEAIDADPMALLPGNPVGALTVDAQALFRSQFGSRLLAIFQARSPLPAEANFSAARDLDRLYVGVYSMQGADVVGIAVGRFDQSKIAKAAENSPRTATGFPIAVSRYARRALYTSGGLGFTTLTAQTLLFGNETGIRRALDRIEEGRIQRRLPKWMEAQLGMPTAPIVGGADLTAHPLSSALREQLAFADGLRTLSLLGNFQEPGVNLAGTLAYDTPEAATRGAENLKKLHGTVSSAGLLMALIGVPQPLRKLDAQATDRETRFVLGVDAAAIAVLLEKVLVYFPAPAARPGSR